MKKPKAKSPLCTPNVTPIHVKAASWPASMIDTPTPVPDGTRFVRFALPDGAWFDVELIQRDGVNGLSIRGNDSFDIKLSVSNHIWLMPRSHTDR